MVDSGFKFNICPVINGHTRVVSDSKMHSDEKIITHENFDRQSDFSCRLSRFSFARLDDNGGFDEEFLKPCEGFVNEIAFHQGKSLLSVSNKKPAQLNFTSMLRRLKNR